MDIHWFRKSPAPRPPIVRDVKRGDVFRIENGDCPYIATYNSDRYNRRFVSLNSGSLCTLCPESKIVWLKAELKVFEVNSYEQTQSQDIT